MKTLFLALLLLPALTSVASAASVSLECDDAKVSLLSRWVRSSVVRVEGAVNWELPWTGKEPLVTGRQLRSDRLRDLEFETATAETDELLLTVPEESHFVAFRERGLGQNPLAKALYVDKSLLSGGEGDGLVIAVQQQQLEITTQRPHLAIKVIHCRSR